MLDFQIYPVAVSKDRRDQFSRFTSENDGSRFIVEWLASECIEINQIVVQDKSSIVVVISIVIFVVLVVGLTSIICKRATCMNKQKVTDEADEFENLKLP